MSENTNNPSEPRKLDDAELDEVTGGAVHVWNFLKERSAREGHKKDVYWLGASTNFGEWLKEKEGEGVYQAWQAWTSQKDRDFYTTYFDDETGKTWSERN